jgi:ribose/xylose/arabinose/galactoside ABC-type transport system permease subunit
MKSERFPKRQWEQAGIVTVLAVICIVITLLEPRFLSRSNLLNVLRLSAILGLATYGQAVVIIGGGIDLSIGSIAAMVSVLSAMMASALGIIPGFVIGALVGSALGGINGVLISRFRVPPFIATFGMLVYAEGVANYISKGAPIEFMPEGFGFLGSGYIGPIPVPIIIAVMMFILVHLLLTRTKLGRCLFAIGGNDRATWLSGIDIRKYRIASYVISGLLTGLAALVLTSRINSGQANIAPSLPFDTIAAVAIGGISLYGGEGKLIQAVLGATIISVINNALNLINVSTYVQMMVMGGVILIAVSFDNLRRSGSKKSFLVRVGEISGLKPTK